AMNTRFELVREQSQRAFQKTLKAQQDRLALWRLKTDNFNQVGIDCRVEAELGQTLPRVSHLGCQHKTAWFDTSDGDEQQEDNPKEVEEQDLPPLPPFPVLSAVDDNGVCGEERTEEEEELSKEDCLDEIRTDGVDGIVSVSVAFHRVEDIYLAFGEFSET
ncbi:unnamed protein product, partial [Prorocentrum cordatum]